MLAEMIAQTTQQLSAEDFDRFVDLPENADLLFELIGGEVIEVPANAFSSMLSSRISFLFSLHLEANPLGFVTGADGGYRINGERYAPDVAFVSYARQKRPAKKGYNPIAPDIAVEVISSGSEKEMESLRIKIANYLLAGTVVLVANSDLLHMELYQPNKKPELFDITGIITFPDVLPNFQLPVKDVFKPILDEIDESAPPKSID